MIQARETSRGPPYISTTTATLGGHPTINQDIPVCAILTLIYFVGSVSNLMIFLKNKRKGHKFLISWTMFIFCNIRVVTCILRLVWATQLENPHIAIAATIFNSAGVLIIYFVVLVFAQRVFRATHPKLGWNKPFSKTLIVSYVLLAGALILTITFTVLSFYTLNMTLRSVARWIQRGAILYMMMFNLLSLVLLILSSLLPPAPDSENFGAGSMNSKLTILGVAVFFSVFNVGFRMGTAWADPRPTSNPAWYDNKPAFYVILFGFEIIIVYLFLFSRIDRRFWVPNGSCQPGDYSRLELEGSKLSEEDINLMPLQKY